MTFTARKPRVLDMARQHTLFNCNCVQKTSQEEESGEVHTKRGRFEADPNSLDPSDSSSSIVSVPEYTGSSDDIAPSPQFPPVQPVNLKFPFIKGQRL